MWLQSNVRGLAIFCIALSDQRSEKMFKSRIRAWGLDKKNKSREVHEILRQQARRRSVGKQTIFILRGRPVDMAAVERYAKRKGLSIDEEPPSSGRPTLKQDLICFTPPPTPIFLDAPKSLRNVEDFLHCFSAFVEESLNSGVQRLGKDVMGFACVFRVVYPSSAQDQFFLSIERGVQRYSGGNITQAYRQWRRAFSQLESVIYSRNYSQLICLVEIIAHLARCRDSVAALLLKYLGDLVNAQCDQPDARLSMLRTLSRLESKDLVEMTALSHRCSKEAFRRHFSRESFSLTDSETSVHDEHSNPLSEGESRYDVLQLTNLVATLEHYDHEAIRLARTAMEILMASERYDVAERVALTHIQRMQSMPRDRVVVGALSHAWTYLTHIYMTSHDYQRAYHCTLMKVENYFRRLQYAPTLPEDFMLSSFLLLAKLARLLDMPEEAERWTQEYEIFKATADKVAQDELSSLLLAAAESDIIGAELQCDSTTLSLEFMGHDYPPSTGIYTTRLKYAF